MVVSSPTTIQPITTGGPKRSKGTGNSTDLEGEFPRSLILRSAHGGYGANGSMELRGVQRFSCSSRSSRICRLSIHFLRGTPRSLEMSFCASNPGEHVARTICLFCFNNPLHLVLGVQYLKFCDRRGRGGRKGGQLERVSIHFVGLSGGP